MKKRMIFIISSFIIRWPFLLLFLLMFLCCYSHNFNFSHVLDVVETKALGTLDQDGSFQSISLANRSHLVPSTVTRTPVVCERNSRFGAHFKRKTNVLYFTIIMTFVTTCSTTFPHCFLKTCSDSCGPSLAEFPSQTTLVLCNLRAG